MTTSQQTALPIVSKRAVSQTVTPTTAPMTAALKTEEDVSHAKPDPPSRVKDQSRRIRSATTQAATQIATLQTLPPIMLMTKQLILKTNASRTTDAAVIAIKTIVKRAVSNQASVTTLRITTAPTRKLAQNANRPINVAHVENWSAARH